MELIKITKKICKYNSSNIFCIGEWTIQSYKYDYNNLIIENNISTLRTWMINV